MTAGTYEEADQDLELRIPLPIVVFVGLPAVMLWAFAGVLIVAGRVQHAPFALVAAVAASVIVVRIGRTGATIGRDGIEVRARWETRRFGWWEVESFSALRVGGGQLLVNMAGGESLTIMGLPSRDYRKRYYRSGKLLDNKLLDNMVADLQHRLQIGRGAEGGS